MTLANYDNNRQISISRRFDLSHRNSTFDRTRVSTSPSLDSRMISPDGERGVGLRQVSGDHRRCGFVAVAIASSS